MGKTIRVYDYVNQPYETVSRILSAGATDVFRNATKVAALRAKDVASELHVNFAGIEIGADVDISVKAIKKRPKKIMSPPRTILKLEWEASKMPHLFPFMKAELSASPLTATETLLEFEGIYEPPFGLLGKALDAFAGHRVAEASVHQFIKDISIYLRN